MRTLLDENVPAELSGCFQVLRAVHIEEIGHKGAKNGQLLSIARASYELLITFDKGLPHQHSHKGEKLRILILRMPDNKMETVLRHYAGIEARALELGEGEHGEYWP